MMYKNKPDGSIEVIYTEQEYKKMYSVRDKFAQLILSVVRTAPKYYFDHPDLLDDMYHAAACARYGMEDHELSIRE